MTKINYLLILTLFMIGCAKNNDSPQEILNSSEIELILKEVYHNGSIDRSYTYNIDDLVDTCYYYYDSGDLLKYRRYEYLGDTILESEFNYENQLRYTYKFYKTSEDTLRRDRQKFFGTPLFTYRLYYFMGNECGFGHSQRFDEDNSLLSQTTYTFPSDNCGNLNTSVEANGDVIGTYESLRDNRNSYFKSARNLLFYPNSWGNIIQHNQWNSSDQFNPANSYESAFTYNSNNYPTNEIRTYGSGSVLDIEYFYFE